MSVFFRKGGGGERNTARLLASVFMTNGVSLLNFTSLKPKSSATMTRKFGLLDLLVVSIVRSSLSSVYFKRRSVERSN